MKCKGATFLIILTAAAAACFANTPVTNSYKAADGSTTVISAVEIEVNLPAATYILKGQAHVKLFDKAARTSLDASADKIDVTLFAAPGDKNTPAGQGVIKCATLTGSPKIIYTSVDKAGNTTTTTATSDATRYDGKERMAYLTGNVKIVSENPALFAEPSVMTGDEAVVNLKPDLAPGDFSFRIKSNSGASRVEVTPKPKEEAPKKP